MFHRSFTGLVIGVTAVGIVPVAHAQASAPISPALARPVTVPVALTPRAVTRTEIVRETEANYKRLDANNDGSVTRAEIEAAQARSEQAVEAQLVKRRAEAFARLDTNQDGQLSLAEFNAGAPIKPRPKADAGQVVQRMDANKDQNISLAEFRAPTLATFDKMDLNRDGIVSIDEQRKFRQGSK